MCHMRSGYRLRTMGVTDTDWIALAQEALLAMDLDVYTPLVERIWSIKDSHGQILALAFLVKVLETSEVVPSSLGSGYRLAMDLDVSTPLPIQEGTPCTVQGL